MYPKPSRLESFFTIDLQVFGKLLLHGRLVKPFPPSGSSANQAYERRKRFLARRTNA